MGILIKDTYTYLPDKQVDNHYFEQILDTSDEWIRKRTGIQARYFSQKSVGEMAILCARPLVQKHPDPKISLIIVATFTDQNPMPSAAASVANACGLFGRVRAFDINVACSGFVAALDLADALLSEGECGLIIGSEKISDFLDMADRGTAILFGDGAGAALVKKTRQESGSDFGLVQDQAYLYLNESGKIKMDGKEVFRFAVNTLKASIQDMTSQYGQPDYIVCHQANERILNHVCQALGLEEEKFYKNIGQIGNTSAASIPLCLNQMRSEKYFQTRTKVLLCGFGAGLTYYSKYVEIEYNDEF